jgi:hypothetical protein
MRAKMKRIAVIATGALWLMAPLTGLAQSPERTAHIGILVGGSQAQRGHLEQALLQGLRAQGYVEGKNLILERRYADGRSKCSARRPSSWQPWLIPSGSI